MPTLWGQFLRSSRESKEIELSEVVAKLRIRQPILEAFEAGDFAATDMSDIQVRGMLRNYARFLELDEDECPAALRRRALRQRKARSLAMAQGQQIRQRQQPPKRCATPHARNRRRAKPKFSPAATVGRFRATCCVNRRLVTIAFVTLELVGPGSAAESAGGTAEANAQIGHATLETAEPAPTIVPTVATPTPVIRSRYSGDGVLVNILVTQRNWMRIISDGVERFAGIAVPDTVHEFDALSEIILSASNAKGLDIEWNSQQQPSFGGRGQRVDIRFTATDIAFSVGPGAAPTLVSPTTRATGVA